MATDDNSNCSNLVLTTDHIAQNIDLFESKGLANWWFTKRHEGITVADSRKSYLITKFPGGNPLRKVIMKLAWAMPMPEIKADEKKVTDPARIEQLNTAIKALQERKVWEGEKNFWAARPWWVIYTFVTGSLFVKLPIPNKSKQVLPERMPSGNSRLLLDENRTKVISGFQFRYQVGTGAFTEATEDGRYVTESIYPGKWVLENDPQFPEGKVWDTPWPWAPVSHMQWEERLEHPRGLPLFDRLSDKLLHIYDAQMDRREASKYAGSKMFVRKNAKGSLPTARAGAVIDIHDIDPTKQSAFESIDTSVDDTLMRNDYLDACRELHEEAFLTFQADDNASQSSPTSGKALRAMSKDEIKYKEAFTGTEASFLQDLFAKILTMEGMPVEAEELTASYDLAVEPDPTERRADAQMWFSEGFDEQGLAAMGITEEKIKAMLEARDAKRTANMVNFGFGKTDPNAPDPNAPDPNADPNDPNKGKSAPPFPPKKP